MKIYAIYDNVALLTSDPFLAVNDDVAKRTYSYVLSRNPSTAKDCDLICVGEFDQVKGFISSTDKSLVLTYADLEKEIK